jgi:cold shock CspA family protein
MGCGVLKWFNKASEYGSIACDDGSPDRYVRGENITGLASIEAGSRVQYESREAGMGPEVTDVCERPPYRRPPRAGRIEAHVDTGLSTPASNLPRTQRAQAQTVNTERR